MAVCEELQTKWGKFCIRNHAQRTSLPCKFRVSGGFKARRLKERHSQVAQKDAHRSDSSCIPIGATVDMHTDRKAGTPSGPGRAEFHRHREEREESLNQIIQSRKQEREANRKLIFFLRSEEERQKRLLEEEEARKLEVLHILPATTLFITSNQSMCGDELD
ncbi:hypothetical protein PHJA_002195200 [Phtheirospermum japonicum]|uniref:Uncharacterized protein n=1 Tax=Phtheirospermum japonicum TaxID=374723 RepID=A0A830CQN5_9LAMI|nr:hypothetical protein PHJA_002195200 [Phtheirospermum japonicum]